MWPPSIPVSAGTIRCWAVETLSRSSRRTLFEVESKPDEFPGEFLKVKQFSACLQRCISVSPRQRKRLKVETTRSAFAYVFAGSGTFRDSSEPRAVLTEKAAEPAAAPVYDVSNHSLVLFDRGDEISVQAGHEGIRFLLVSGKPIEEPVAWYGPIVMNTPEQLRQAMRNCKPAPSSKHRSSAAREPLRRPAAGVRLIRSFLADGDAGCRT